MPTNHLPQPIRRGSWAALILLLAACSGGGDDATGPADEPVKPEDLPAYLDLTRLEGRHGRRPQCFWGTAFAVDAAGHFVLPAHLLADADHVELRGLGSARIVARDAALDLALLQAGRGLPPLPLRMDAVERGAAVQVVGFPFSTGRQGGHGLAFESQSGRGVSGWVHEAPSDRALTLSMSVNAGFSGAPVLDEHGDVCGMVNAARAHGLARGEAMASSVVADFLDGQGVAYTRGGAPLTLAPHELVARGQRSIAAVLIIPKRIKGRKQHWRPPVPRRVLTHGREIPRNAAWSADGAMLALDWSFGIELYDVNRQRSLAALPIPDNRSPSEELAFTPDGRYLLCVRSGAPFLFSVDERKLWNRFARAWGGAVSPNSRYVALVQARDALVEGAVTKPAWGVGIYDVTSGERVTTIAPVGEGDPTGMHLIAGTTDHICFMPSSGYLATVGTYTQRIGSRNDSEQWILGWDPDSGAFMGVIPMKPPPPNTIVGLAVTRDESRLLVTWWEHSAGHLRAWLYDVRTGERLLDAGEVAGHMHGASYQRRPCLSHDGRVFGVGKGLFELETGMPIWRFDGGGVRALSPVADKVAVGYYDMQVYDYGAIVATR